MKDQKKVLYTDDMIIKKKADKMSAGVIFVSIAMIIFLIVLTVLMFANL